MTWNGAPVSCPVPYRSDERRAKAQGSGAGAIPPGGPEQVRLRACGRFWTGVLQTPARVNVTCVTPLGEEVDSTW